MAGGQRVICAAAGLAEGGRGRRFDWPPAGGEGKAFAVRYDGVVRAYVNRCPHLGVELDWQPGEFFEESGLYLICSTHGALFDPSTGLCVAGPCQGARLEAIVVLERDGEVLLHETAHGAPQGAPP
jgi:nitrite reductase/ring-hydroxylating ferredoxin subunit